MQIVNRGRFGLRVTSETKEVNYRATVAMHAVNNIENTLPWGQSGAVNHNRNVLALPGNANSNMMVYAASFSWRADNIIK